MAGSRLGSSGYGEADTPFGPAGVTKASLYYAYVFPLPSWPWRFSPASPCWAPWWVGVWENEVFDVIFMMRRLNKTPPQSPGHQGAKSGGAVERDRVLWCSNLAMDFDYESVDDVMKAFGIVERIKLSLAMMDFIIMHM